MLPETHKHLSLPPLEPALKKYRSAIEGLVRPAWLLRCRKVETVSRYCTHIGGNTPFAPVKDGWPECGKCGKPLEFVWQIDFADFGGAAVFEDHGLFQFFYCWECFPLPPEDEFGYASRWYPDFGAERLHGIPLLDAPYKLTEAFHGEIGPYDVDIVPFLSIPDMMDEQNPIPEKERRKKVDDGNDDLWDVYDYLIDDLYEGDEISRVGGYPAWIQYDHTPNCPVCGKRTEFVGAIGSDDTDLLWGDSGYWYFFACRATEECYGLAKPFMRSQSY